MALEIGTLLNERYRIERILGQGGFGAVYLALDQDLGIQCAVKENLNTSPQAERQFRREATLLAGLRHPNLPRVTDHFILASHQYLVMDFVEGDDLRQQLEASGALPPSDALRWMLQLCDALAYLHGQKPAVIHRDIKPANIKITPEGQAVLVDFGIAKVAEAGQKTTTGAAALTSGYAPPEQYQMGSTDGRTDEYALAATLYHLLTGRIPPDSVERLIGQASLAPVEELRPDVAPNVAAALRRALEIRPDARFPGVADFAAALQDPDYRYAAAPAMAEPAASAPAETTTQAAATQAAAAPATAPRPRTWRDAAAAFGLSLWVLFASGLLTAGLAWVLIGPWRLNNQALIWLGRPTNPPVRLAGAPPETLFAPLGSPYPTSTPYLSPTPSPTRSPTPAPSLTPSPTSPSTPTFTPAPQPVSAENAAGWRPFSAWSVGDPEVLAALSPDGRTAAVYQPQDVQGVELVDAVTGASQAELRGFIVARGRPLDLAYTPDSILVLFENEILVWGLERGAVVERLSFFKAPARELRLSPDREWAAVRAEYLTVYNLASKRLYNLGDQGASQAYAFAPDGRAVALAVGTDVEVYSLANGRLERRLLGRNKAIRGLAYTADGARLVATSGDVWDAASGERLATFDSAAGLETVTVSPNGAVIVGGDGEVWALGPRPAGKLARVGRVTGLPAGLGRGQMHFIQDGALLFVQAPGQAPALFSVDPNAPRAAAGPTPASAATPDREIIGLLNVSRLGALETVPATGAAGMGLSPSGERALTWANSTLSVVNLAGRDLLASLDTSPILDAAFLDDDFVLLLVSRNRAVWVERWEIATREKRQDYGPFDEKARRLAASGPANLLAVQGKYIDILDVESGDLRHSLGSADSYQPFAFTPDGRYLAIAARAAVSLWDMRTGGLVPGQFGGHGPDVTGLSFTPDGRLMAGASGDVWEVASRRRLAAFDPAPAVALSPDGALAVGSDGALWDAGTGQYLGRLAERARALAFTPDGRTLFWHAAGGQVSLFGIRPIAAHQRPAGAGRPSPDLLALSPTNVVSAAVLGWWGRDPVLDLRLIQDPPQPRAAAFGDSTVEAITLSPDQKTYTALVPDGLEQIDPATGAVVDRYAIFLNPDEVVDVAYVGEELLLLKGRAGVERWDLSAQTLAQRYNVQGEGLVVSPDGRWFALRQAGNVLVVEAASGEVRYRYRVQAGAQEYQFAPDSRSLAVTTGAFVEFYDLESGKLASRLRGRSGRPFGLVFAPDGARLYAASGDAWALPGGEPAYAGRLDLAATRLAVSPDGALLAGDDGSLWDTATGLRVATLPEVRGPAVELFFTADGKQLLWRLADGRVYTWAVRPPAPAAPPAFGSRAITVENAHLLAITGHLGRGRLREAVWSPGDQYLAVNTTANAVIYAGETLERRRAFLDAAVLTFDAQGRALVGGLNHPLQLVEVETGAVVKDYRRTGILAAAYSPDGRQLALGGRLTPDSPFLDGVAVIDPDGLERTFSAGLGSYTRFTGFTFTSDGQHLVVSFPGVNVRGSIWLWDVANGSRVREPIQGNSLPAAVSPDGKYLAYLSGTRLVRENLATGGGKLYINADGAPFIQQSIDYPTKFPLAYQFVSSGELLVFYSDTSRRGRGTDSSAVLWRFSATSVEGPRAKFPAALENPQMNGLLRLDRLSGLYQADYARDRERLTPTFGLGPAEKYAYSLTGDGLVRVWSFETGRELARSEADTLPLMALSPDGRTVAVPDANGAIELRALDTGALLRSFGGEWAPDALVYDSASLLLLWQAGQVFLVSAEDGRVIETYSGDLYARPEFVTVSPAGGLFAQWARPGGRTVLNVFSLAPDRALFSLGVFPRPDHLRFAPDGRLLAVAKGRTVELWDLETRRLAATLAAQGRAVGALAFSPDGARLYAATGEIWEVATGTLLTTFDSQAAAIALSPNNRLIVGAEGTLWNAADGLLTGALAGLRGPAVNFALTPDGERLVWQAGDGVIEVWSLP